MICYKVDSIYEDIALATNSTYTPVSGDVNKFIKVKVTPVTLTGTLTGTAVTSASYTGDTMYISTFATGASAVIKLGGPDWAFVFDINSVNGTDTITTANRNFTISDGTKIANITLTLH